MTGLPDNADPPTNIELGIKPLTPEDVGFVPTQPRLQQVSMDAPTVKLADIAAGKIDTDEPLFSGKWRWEQYLADLSKAGTKPEEKIAVVEELRELSEKTDDPEIADVLEFIGRVATNSTNAGVLRVIFKNGSREGMQRAIASSWTKVYLLLNESSNSQLQTVGSAAMLLARATYAQAHNGKLYKLPLREGLDTSKEYAAFVDRDRPIGLLAYHTPEADYEHNDPAEMLRGVRYRQEMLQPALEVLQEIGQGTIAESDAYKTNPHTLIALALLLGELNRYNYRLGSTKNIEGEADLHGVTSDDVRKHFEDARRLFVATCAKLFHVPTNLNEERLYGSAIRTLQGVRTTFITSISAHVEYFANNSEANRPHEAELLKDKLADELFNIILMPHYSNDGQYKTPNSSLTFNDQSNLYKAMAGLYQLELAQDKREND